MKKSLKSILNFYLEIAGMRHELVKNHSIRVAILATKVAVKLKYDHKATYIAGILHDLGKISLPYNLFDGHNINQEEYNEVKTHTILGYKALKDEYLFTGLVTGFHHALSKNGYGLTLKDFPDTMSIETVKKVMDIAVLISICDFVDAATSRTTIRKDGDSSMPLRDSLVSKFPNNIFIVDTVLNEHYKLTRAVI